MQKASFVYKKHLKAVSYYYLQSYLHLNQEHWIAELVAGEESAYRRLITEFGKKVYNTCLGFVQNIEDAEEVSQDVFVAIFQSVENFKGESKLSTWIYRISVTQSLAFLRKKKRKKRFAIIQRLFSGEDKQLMFDIPHFYHPGIQLEDKERAAILFAKIEDLPENQKTAFILHKVQGLSYAEVGEVMQLSLSSIESLMFRAKQNLKKSLSNYYYQ